MNKAKIAAALGASRRIPLPRAPQDPLDALMLMQAIHDQLEAGRGLRAGRPSSPAWTLRRLVPFSAESWDTLQSYAEAFSAPGRRVSPAQVAAVILEGALRDERPAGEPRAEPEANGTTGSRPARRTRTRPARASGRQRGTAG